MLEANATPTSSKSNPMKDSAAFELPVPTEEKIHVTSAMSFLLGSL
jgi:hypothetical protein